MPNALRPDEAAWLTALPRAASQHRTRRSPDSVSDQSATRYSRGQGHSRGSTGVLLGDLARPARCASVGGAKTRLGESEVTAWERRPSSDRQFAQGAMPLLAGSNQNRLFQDLVSPCSSKPITPDRPKARPTGGPIRNLAEPHVELTTTTTSAGAKGV